MQLPQLLWASIAVVAVPQRLGGANPRSFLLLPTVTVTTTATITVTVMPEGLAWAAAR